MEDGNSNMTPQVPLSDNAGVANVAPSANETKAGPMDASTTTQEEAVSMLDVHAPYEVVHTWKAFFIHIATIAVGLLIAIGLEQAVEYFHHRHQAREMADMLRQESSKNRDVARFDVERADQIILAIETNMDALKSLSNSASKSTFTPHPLPEGQFFMPSDAAWITMRDSALLPIIPPTLVGNYWKIETTIQGLEARYHDSIRSQNHVNSLLNLQPNASMPAPQVVDTLLSALSDYREQLRGYRSLLLSFLAANDLALAGTVIDFTAAISAKEHLAQPR